MTDRYQNISSGINAPAIDAFAITPSDALDLNEVVRGLYIGTAGDVTLLTKDGSEVVFTGLVSGSILPVRAVRVKATGTSAANMVGLV